MFRSLTLPLLRPILVMVVILNGDRLVPGLRHRPGQHQGRAGGRVAVLQMYIYDKAFGQFDFGYAATMSLALFLMLVTVTFTRCGWPAPTSPTLS